MGKVNMPNIANMINLNKALCLPRMQPSFLIIGAQKAGTSALHYYLSQHPNLVSASCKEIDFFSCSAKYSQGYSSYHLLFPIRRLTRQWGFEASPSYLQNPHAAERIYEYNRNMKLIAVIRDPVMRAFSAWRMYTHYFSQSSAWFIKWMNTCCGSDWNHTQLLKRTQSSLESFDVYIQQEIEATLKGQTIEAPVLPHGLYYKHLSHYADYFDRSQLLLLESNGLLNEPLNELEKVESFLGAPRNDWKKADLRPIFVGHCNSGISEDAVTILKDYYYEDSKALFSTFNISFESIG